MVIKYSISGNYPQISLFQGIGWTDSISPQLFNFIIKNIVNDLRNKKDINLE